MTLKERAGHRWFSVSELTRTPSEPVRVLLVTDDLPMYDLLLFPDGSFTFCLSGCHGSINDAQALYDTADRNGKRVIEAMVARIREEVSAY